MKYGTPAPPDPYAKPEIEEVPSRPPESESENWEPGLRTRAVRTCPKCGARSPMQIFEHGGTRVMLCGNCKEPLPECEAAQ